MKESYSRNKHEFGQVIPLVVLMMFAIIAMVALILDGGALMSNRRTAQAAADSGALAGAKQLCMGNPSQALYDAKYYAAMNGADTPVTEPTISGGMIDVITSVTHGSFFAGIFGKSTLSAGAEAQAGCYGPAGKAVLPLAWICKGPNAGELPFDPNMDCEIQALSWDNLLLPLVKGQVPSIQIDGLEYSMDSKYTSSITTPVINSSGVTEYLPPKEIYIVIDTDKVCIEDSDPPYPTGAIVCDLDGDGKKEIQTGGERGWLYLTADTNNITKWITQVPPFNLQTHVWLSGKSGGDVNVFDKLISYDYVGERVLIPVYNYLCEGDPRVDASCMAAAHDPLYWPPEPAGGDIFDEIRSTSDNYHIITFDAFYISCVSKKGDCPGANYARSIDPELGEVPSMEGFFLTDVGLSADYAQNCAVNLGNCIVSLSK